ncbi:MAG: proton-conducting membrane transporter [Defluviitaleaceae bacterium]|nr:proton-conducting membrane transporter [Defluviitaleaceae bacterium]
MLTYFVIIPVLIAVFLFVFASNKGARVLAILFQAVFVALSLYLLWETRGEEITVVIGDYYGVMGIILRAYTTSAVFMVLCGIVFLAVAIYSFNQSDSRTFWFLLFILQSALVGLFLTRDLFNIFVLVEVSTVIVIILLMYDKKNRNMLSGLVFLMLNIVAMLLYLFGIGYIYMLTGVFDIQRAGELLAYVDYSDKMIPYALIMTGIAFKCSIIPIFSFLPKVKLYPKAPSAVAAILSGVQIKTMVYMFLRMQDMFGDFSSHNFFLAVGIVASLAGVIMAICQTDVKMILAYHTMSQVGLIIIGLSANNEYAMLGGLYHILSHATFKSALFLSIGIIVHSYGTRDVYKIRGVLRRMPIVGMVTLFAVLGITGAPFFIGSISKYFIAADVPFWLNATVIVISLGTIISFIKYAGILFGKDLGAEGDAVKPDIWRIVPSAALGIFCLVGGIFGGHIINFLFPLYDSPASIDTWGYIEKSLIFLGSAVVGFLIYKYIVYGNNTLKRIGRLNIGFRSACAAMGAFFGLIVIFVGVM